MEFATKCEATRYTGGLSKPEKMPCPAYSLEPLVTCPGGARLAARPGTVCRVCYGTAKSGRYFRFRKTMLPLWEKRLQATKGDGFVDAMTKLISGLPYFRWHDTGDVYSAQYALKILQIAKNCPDTRFWLPTRELWIRKLPKPTNLVVRYAMPLVDQTPEQVRRFRSQFPTIATVTTNHDDPDLCRMVSKPSRQGKGVVRSCGDCRRCFDPDEAVVAYPLHSTGQGNYNPQVEV